MNVPPRAPFTPAVIYRDPRAALDWLARAFGFETTMLITDETGAVGHAEMSHAGGQVMIGGEWSGDFRSPASLGGQCTQGIHVHLAADLDGHCERARAAGAEILAEPAEQFYGDRTYRARDLEGHVWTFGQTTRQVGRAEAEAASGLTIEAAGWT